MPKATIKFIPVPSLLRVGEGATLVGLDGPAKLVGRTVRCESVAGVLDGCVSRVDPNNTAHVLVVFGRNVYSCHWLTLEAEVSDNADVLDRLDAQPKSPDGIQCLAVDLYEGDTAPNPANCMGEAFKGPCTLSYVRFPDGGVDITATDLDRDEEPQEDEEGADVQAMTLDVVERIEVDIVRETDTDPEEGRGAIVGEGDREWYVFEDREAAGAFARQHWAEMPASELRCIIGDECLVAWALGEWAGPGSTQVRNLSEWLDLHKDAPEETLASYDSEECSVDAVTEALVEVLGFTPTVAYRIN